MANEIVFSGIGDLTIAESLTNAYILLAAERQALQNHPALMYVGDIGVGARSNTIKVSHVGLMGYDLLASTGDGNAVANSALTDGSSTVAVARYSKSYEASDLARITAGGLVNIDAMAMDAVLSGALTLTSLIANLVDNFSTTVGTSGVDATAANFLDAITANEIAHTEGPLLAMLHPVQWGDMRKDLAVNTGGALQFMPATADLIAFRGTGFQGTLAGVDVFTSTFVPTANAGADRAGGMFGKGAILWGDGTIPMENDPNQIVIAGKVLFERVRTGKSGLTAYVSHRYLGVVEGIDGFGVSIITDA
jgi:hypothetical protein